MSFVHLQTHTMFSMLDGVAKPSDYFEEAAKRGYPAHAITEHGNMGSVPDAYFSSKDTGVKYIAGCFTPNQKVYTQDGIKIISEITNQDYVLTHTNNFKKVLNTQKRPYDGNLVRIKSWCVEDQLATPEHPFLIREVLREEKSKGVWEETISRKWMKAGEIERLKYHKTYSTKKSKDRGNKRRYKHYLCVPRISHNKRINSIDLNNFNIFLDGTINENNGIIESVTYIRNNYKDLEIIGNVY